MEEFLELVWNVPLVAAPALPIQRMLVQAGVDLNSLSPLLSLHICAIPTLWIAWQFHVAVERRFVRGLGRAARGQKRVVLGLQQEP